MNDSWKEKWSNILNIKYKIILRKISKEINWIIHEHRYKREIGYNNLGNSLDLKNGFMCAHTHIHTYSFLFYLQPH